MKNHRLFIALSILLILLLIVGNYFWENPERQFDYTEEMMDTYVTISVYNSNEEKAKEIIEKAFNKISELNLIASRFNTSSELYKLNINGFLDNPSNELVEMIKTSKYFSNITEGAFDITILPLLDLWSNDIELSSINNSFEQELNNSEFSVFLRENFSQIQPPLYDLNESPIVEIQDNGWIVSSSWHQYKINRYDHDNLIITTKFYYLPYETQQFYINQTFSLIGSNKIMISEDKIQLEPGMKITLDGMAKGYIVDEVIELLKENGVKNAMIDAGGDIATLGIKAGGEKWTIGLRNPNNKSESIAEFQLSNLAITTSGNYERYFDEDAEIGHIMDPLTGRTVNKCSSASIIAETCTEADILSTAVFVLGPEKGLQIVETLQNTETIIIGYENPKELTYSSGINEFII